MARNQGVLFARRFLEKYVGSKILNSPKTAVIELVANAWDAGTQSVKIIWPSVTSSFVIEDCGIGMTDDEFQHRWRELSYDRIAEQGDTVKVIGQKGAIRQCFGCNGVGRFAGFAFADEYFVETWRDGVSNTYSVAKGETQPFVVKPLTQTPKTGSGTKIFVTTSETIGTTNDEIRAEIGMRFLADPSFSVQVDGVAVTFEDIPEANIERQKFEIPSVGQIELIVIDTQKSDRSTMRHGVAWHVNGRLVGECSWKGTDDRDLIDGRRNAAKRFLFIVLADCLGKGNAVRKDWSGFDDDNPAVQAVSAEVYGRVRERTLKVTEAERDELFKKVKTANQPHLNRMTLCERKMWNEFVTQTQVNCPSILERDLIELASLLARLEASQSKYGLIQRFGELQPNQLDEWYQLLGDWTTDTAKIVLDEIRTRSLLLEELRRKVKDNRTDEVQELQPLFERGLWIFGPEFETIEYTSNEGMTHVIQKLFKPNNKIHGTRNRPDFVVVPDGSVGFYSYPRYDDFGGEIGVDRVAIVELKRPGVPISTDEKAQCWKYVRELLEKGQLQASSRVRCYVLGSIVDPHEAHARLEMDGAVVIQPMNYDSVIERAKSRLLRLSDRITDAPFLNRKDLEEFVSPITSHAPRKQQDLFGEPA